MVTSILMKFNFGEIWHYPFWEFYFSYLVYLQILNSASNLGMPLTVNIFLDVIVTQWTLHCKEIPRDERDKNEMKGVSYSGGCGGKNCVILCNF